MKTMKNIFIVTISVDYSNARKVCETIENQKYDSLNDLRNRLELHLGVNDSDKNQPQFFSLTDFMDECNDQYLDLESVFISYVKIENL
jgi:hypothetical protein